MMNSEIKQKWINALLSGEYEQNTQGCLHTANEFSERYCCLGVLCDLYAKEHNKEWTNNYGRSNLYFEGEGHYPPQSVVEWAGLPERNPSIKFSGKIGEWKYENPEITVLNDDGISFNTIADLIEQHL